MANQKPQSSLAFRLASGEKKAVKAVRPKPSVKPGKKPNQVSFSSSLVFDPTGQQSEILSAEDKARRNLYLLTAGRDLATEADQNVALENAGLLKGGVSPAERKRLAKGGSSEFASAMDALDALGRGADKFAGEAIIPLAAGGLLAAYGAADIVSKGIDKALGSYKAGVIENNPELGKETPLTASEVLASYREGVLQNNPKLGKEKPSIFGFKGKPSDAVWSALGNIPIPTVQPPVIRASSTGQLYSADFRQRRLGEVQDVAQDIVAKPNQYVDAGAKDKTIIENASVPITGGIELANNGVTGPEIQTYIEQQAEFDGISPNEDAALKARAQKEGHDVSNWNSMLAGEKIAMAYLSSNPLLVTFRNGVRSIAATGATPAGVKAVGDAGFALLRGDTSEGRTIINGILEPYAYAKQVAERDGLAAGLGVYVRDNPVDAALVFNTAIRAGGRIGGVVARAGKFGGKAEEFAQVGRRVAVPRGKITEVREVPLTPGPFRFDPKAGPLVQQYVDWQERSRVAQVANADEIKASVDAGRVSEAGVPYRIERAPGADEVLLGYTTPNLTSGLSLKFKGALAKRWDRYADRILDDQGRKYTRTLANIADGVAVEVERIITEAIGKRPTAEQLDRIAWDLSRDRELFGGEAYTPKVEADYYRRRIEEEMASPEYRRDPENSVSAEKIVRWRAAADRLDQIDGVVIDPEVSARVRVAAKKVGDENLKIIASALGQSVSDAKRQDRIRLLVVDPRFEDAARALKAEKNLGKKSPKALIRAQQRIRVLSEKMGKKVSERGYGSKSAPKSRARFVELRDELVGEVRRAERAALELGDEALAAEYRAIREQLTLSRVGSSERSVEVADRAARVGRLEADVADVPVVARGAYEAAQEAKRVEDAAEAASVAATAAERQALSAAGVGRVDDRIVALAEQAAEQARQESASLAGLRGEFIRGVIADMRGKRWAEVPQEIRAQYSDDRPGWVSVEYVRASDLRGMAGNPVDDAKVQALRGQEYENPIILDYDPDTGLGYISEGNHRLAAAADDQWVPLQVMRGHISDQKALERVARYGQSTRLITKPKAIVDETDYAPLYIYPHEIGFNIRAVDPTVKAAREKATGRVESAEERLVALREARAAQASGVEARGVLREAIGKRESAARQAQRIVEKNAPILDANQVRAALDAAGDVASIRVRQKKDYGYYTLDRARGEVLDDFIARVEAADKGALLHLVQRGSFERIDEPVVMQIARSIETGPRGRIRKGRLKPSTGSLFAIGGEDFAGMWRNLMFDTSELQSAVGWRKRMQQLIEMTSVKVSVSEQILSAAKRVVDERVRQSPDLVASYDDLLRTAVKEELVRDSYEFGLGDFELLNPIEPKAKKPTKRSARGVVEDQEDVKTLLTRMIDDRAIDPNAPGDYYLMPRALYKGIQSSLADEAFSFRPGSVGYKLDRVMRAWRSLTLNVLPRTAFANFAGSAILSLQGGAGPRSWMYAWRALTGRVDPRTGRAYPIPQELLQRYYDQFTPEIGRSGRFIDQPTAVQAGASWVAWWMNSMRRLNGMSEDFGRLAVWYSKAVPEALTLEERGIGSIIGRAKLMNDSAMDLLDAMANNDPSWVAKNDAWLRQSYDFLGYLHRGGKKASWLRIAIPFWQWYEHMLKLTFVTMPLKYPGRALFLQQLGEIGDEYQRAHGVIAPGSASLIPLWTFEVPVEGMPQFVVKATDSSPWYPQATVSSLADKEGDLGLSRYVRSGVNPQFSNLFLLVQSVMLRNPQEYSDYTGLTAAKDEYGNDLKGFDWRYVVNKLGQMMPLAPSVMSMAGRPSNSLLWDLKEKPPTGTSLPTERTDLLSVFEDPWGPNPVQFFARILTGIQLKDTPGIGQIQREILRKQFEYEARQAAREESNIARIVGSIANETK